MLIRTEHRISETLDGSSQETKEDVIVTVLCSKMVIQYQAREALHKSTSKNQNISPINNCKQMKKIASSKESHCMYKSPLREDPMPDSR